MSLLIACIALLVACHGLDHCRRMNRAMDKLEADIERLYGKRGAR